MARRGRRGKGRNTAIVADTAPDFTASAAPLTSSEIAKKPFAERQVSISRIVAPSFIWQGRLSNPDEVLRKFGSYEGLAFYDRILRQFAFLRGVCNQAVQRIAAIDRVIKPGDADNPTSVQMAEDATRAWKRVKDKTIVLQKMLYGRFYGFYPVGKVWSKDDASGLLAPMELYDIPPWYLKFGVGEQEGKVFLLTQRGFASSLGEEIEPRALMFFRWGSTWTPYGEGDLKFCYLPTWYIQRLREMQSLAIEIFGKPIPWVVVPTDMDPADYDVLEAGLRSQYKYYVITKSATVQKPEVTFPSTNILANGAAGKSELEAIRHYVGEIYIAILGTQQTQDKTGGSRALEDTRLQIAGDQTPPGSQALDEALTTGWLDDIGEVNWPNQPRELWPRFESDASDARTDSLTGPQVTALLDIAAKLVAKQVSAPYATELLVRSTIPRNKAAEMVKSIVTGDLQPTATDAAAQPAQEQGDTTNSDDGMMDTAGEQGSGEEMVA